MKFLEKGIMLGLETGTNTDPGWEEEEEAAAGAALMYVEEAFSHRIPGEFLIYLTRFNCTDIRAAPLCGCGNWTKW